MEYNNIHFFWRAFAVAIGLAKAVSERSSFSSS